MKNKDDDKDAGYIALAGAILKLAVDEYVEAIRDKDKSKQEKLEKFFLSEWGQLLSLDHGNMIIEKARKIAQEKKDGTGTLHMHHL